MEAILVTVKDLVKYKIVSSINTGDKTLDSLYVALSATILTVVFTISYWKVLLDYLKIIIGKIPKCSKIVKKEENSFSLAKDQEALIKILDASTTHKSTIVDIKMEKFYMDQLYLHVLHEGIINRSTFFYPQHNRLTTRTLGGAKNAISAHFGRIKPIFVYGKEVIGIHFKSENEDNYLYIYYETLEGLLAFNKTLEKYKSKDIMGKNELSIFEKDTYAHYPLYSDRTFDGFVSLHKPHILNSLKDFTEALEGKSKFNGFGSYNLGILLYGPPGTGKTSIIKAVCNYLKRDAKIVDLRDIKTKTAFAQVFGNVSDVLNNVFIFEEFDSVQGVISRDREIKDENSQEKGSEKKELRDEYFKLLELKTKSKKKDENQEEKETKKKENEDEDEIDKEIKSLKTKMKELDEALTCDNILTVLDGIQEYRGRVIIATTNYIDRIDKALLREGRFDLKIHLEPFITSEIKELLSKMYSQADLSLLEKVKFPEKKWTPVQIINLCHRFQTFEKVVEILSQNN